jgi:hypothetical protein
LKNILGELTKTDALSRILLNELFSSAGITSIPNLLNGFLMSMLFVQLRIAIETNLFAI